MRPGGIGPAEGRVDHAGVVQEPGVDGAEGQRRLHRGVGLVGATGRQQRPGVCVVAVDVLAALELRAGERHRPIRIQPVIGQIERERAVVDAGRLAGELGDRLDRVVVGGRELRVTGRGTERVEIAAPGQELGLRDDRDGRAELLDRGIEVAIGGGAARARPECARNEFLSTASASAYAFSAPARSPVEMRTSASW